MANQDLGNRQMDRTHQPHTTRLNPLPLRLQTRPCPLSNHTPTHHPRQHPQPLRQTHPPSISSTDARRQNELHQRLSTSASLHLGQCTRNSSLLLNHPRLRLHTPKRQLLSNRSRTNTRLQTLWTPRSKTMQKRTLCMQ